MIKKFLKPIYHYYLILKSGLFDRKYYLENYPDVRKANMDPLWHFIRWGWKEGRNPSQEFNTKNYLINYLDVKQLNINPLIHYIKHGRNEGREKLSKNNTNILISDSVQSKKFSLYFHIGQYKTGTSIIQNFLDINRINLYKSNYTLYPNFNEYNLLKGRNQKHYDWYLTVRYNEAKFINDMKRVYEFVNNNDIQSVILSNEDWFIQTEIIDQIYKMKWIWKNINIKIILYLRRIDSYVESAWKQYGLKVYDKIEDFYDQQLYKEMYKYTYNLLEKWENAIGVENIILRPYEKNQLNKGLISDFLSIVGIDYDSNDWNTTENTNQAKNLGFNRDTLEILHYCRDLFPSASSNHLFDLFHDLLGDKFQKKPFEPYLLLSPNQRKELIQSNSLYESKLAKRYLSRSNGKVFYESPLDENIDWKPYEGLTLEKIIPFFVKMIDENNKKIRILENKLSEIMKK